MKFVRFFPIFLALALGACVSTQEYRTRVDEVNTLKKENAACDEKLKAAETSKDQTEKELSEVKGKLSSISGELSTVSLEKNKAIEEKEKAVAELKKTYDSMVSELNEEIKKGEIAVTQLKGRLSLSMVEKILFDSGSSQIKPTGKKVLERVADILKKSTDRQIRIEGHTDNVPISSKLAKIFPSNWELSSARATNVVKLLIEYGVDPSFLSTSGYAEFHPVDSNDSEEGRAKNRRIEIVLIPIEKGMNSL